MSPPHHTPPTDIESALIRNYAAVSGVSLPSATDLINGYQGACIRAMIHENPNLTFPTPYASDIYTP